MIGPAPRVAVPALSRSERSCMSPSVAPVRRSGSIARRNARSRAAVTTSSVSQPILSSLPGNTAVMASQGRAGMDRGLPRPLTGSPWENGYIESFNARLRDELLNGEVFYTLREAQIVIESWRRHYNTIRPHASIGYKPPAPEVFVPAFTAWAGGSPVTTLARLCAHCISRHSRGGQSR